MSWKSDAVQVTILGMIVVITLVVLVVWNPLHVTGTILPSLP